MPDWSRRRTLSALAALPAASLAGCSGLVPGESDDGDEQTYTLHLNALDAPLADYVLWSPSENESRDDDLEAEARRTAIEDGRFTTYGFSPVDHEGVYTEYEGRYYRLSVVVTGEREMDRHVLRLHWLGQVGDEGVPEPDAAIEDLPDVDNNAAKIAYFAARSREFGQDTGPDEFVQRGGFVYRRGLSEDSVLVPDSEYDTLSFHGDTVLRVEAAVERIREPAYTVVATDVADSAAAFEDVAAGAKLAARVDPDSLSEAQRTMVAKARGESYEETTPLSDAYEGLLDAFALGRGDRHIERNYVRYGDEDFRCERYVSGA